MNIFTAEDFKEVLHNQLMEWPKGYQDMADIANAKLEKIAVIGYAYSNTDRYIISGNEKLATEKALIIRLENKKCEHKDKKVISIHWLKDNSSNFEDMYFRCECGATVKFTQFEEIK